MPAACSSQIQAKKRSSGRRLLHFGMHGHAATAAVTAALFVSVLLIPFPLSATSGTSQRSYQHEFDAVWSAAIGALQVRGNAIIHSDKANGIITSDFKVDQEEEIRHKFNLLLTKDVGKTNVSVTSVVETYEGAGAFTAAGWEGSKSDGVREAKLLDAITLRLQPGGAEIDAADVACRSNLTVGGSMVRGSTYSTFVEFAELATDAAVDALVRAIANASLEVVTVDKSTGSVRATEHTGGKSRVIDFTVTPAGRGSRIKITQKYGIGQRGSSAEASDQFCGILGTVAAAMPRSNSTSSIPATVGEPQTIEDRLKKLEELFKKGLITEDEYKKKRAELLSKL